jgi:hypothetical protein
MQVLWRLCSPSSGELTECQVIDRRPLFPEVRLVHVERGVTLASGSFTGIQAAVNAAAVLGAALRADGWLHFL